MTAHTMITICETLPSIGPRHAPAVAGGRCAGMQPRGRGTYPLLPRHGIRLFAPHGEGERFARLFADTWKQMPLGPRRSILRHWREPLILLGGLTGPYIELLDDWSDRQRGRGLRGDKAVVSWQGHRLRFWRRVVIAYPDALVKDLIAHELAHVYQESWGFEFEDADECEADADWWVERWGFSSEAMDEWDLAHGISRVIDWDSLSQSDRRHVLKEFERSGRMRVAR